MPSETPLTDATPAAEAPPFALGAKLCADYARLSAKAAAIEAELAAAIAPLKAAADRKLAPLLAEIDVRMRELEPWWQAHGVTLTKGKAKSAEHAGAVLGTRASPGKLLFKGSDDKAATKAAIAALLLARLPSLLVRSYAVDKDAVAGRIEAEPDGALAQMGFSVSKPETFFVKPAAHAGRAR